MTTSNTSICAFCKDIKDLDTELIVVTDEWGNLELRCSQCIDGEEIRNATGWIRQELTDPCVASTQRPRCRRDCSTPMRSECWRK